MTLDPTWILSALCAVLVYLWKRQETRIDELEDELARMNEKYVARHECTGRAKMLEKTLDRACDKLDRLAEHGGSHE